MTRKTRHFFKYYNTKEIQTGYFKIIKNIKNYPVTSKKWHLHSFGLFTQNNHTSLPEVQELQKESLKLLKLVFIDSSLMLTSTLDLFHNIFRHQGRKSTGLANNINNF